MSTKPFSNLLGVTILIAFLAACSPPPAGAPAADDTTAPPAAATTESSRSESATTAPESTAGDTDTSADTDTDADAETETEADPAADAPSDLPTGVHTYVIVPEESSASYHMHEEFFGLALGKYGIPAGLQETIGTTSAIEGQFQLNWDDLSNALGENTFTVDLSTLKSNQGLRDSWIRENGPEFNKFPTATFVAESIEGAPDAYTPGEEVSFQMVGQMTIHETTKPATFEITAKHDNGTITGNATAALKLTDFGITPPDFVNTLTVADDFRVTLEFTAREQ